MNAVTETGRCSPCEAKRAKRKAGSYRAALTARCAELDALNADLLAALKECEEYFDQRADTVDGPDSRPVPNAAAHMREMARTAIAKTEGDAK